MGPKTCYLCGIALGLVLAVTACTKTNTVYVDQPGNPAPATTTPMGGDATTPTAAPSPESGAVPDPETEPPSPPVPSDAPHDVQIAAASPADTSVPPSIESVPFKTVAFVAGQYGGPGSADGPFLSKFLEEVTGGTDINALPNLATLTSSPANLRSSNGIACDFSGLKKCFIVDTGDSSIRVMDLETREVSTLAGGQQGYNIGGAANGFAVGKNAKFNTPRGAALSPDKKYLYVADAGNNVIRRVTINTATVQTFAGSSTGYGGPFRFDNGKPNYSSIGASLELSLPMDVKMGEDGALYVLDSGNLAIRRLLLDAQGNITGEWQIPFRDQTEYTKLAFPAVGFALMDGFIYVADYSAKTIWKVDVGFDEVNHLFTHWSTQKVVSPSVTAADPYFHNPQLQNSDIGKVFKGSDYKLDRPYGIATDPAQHRLFVSAYADTIVSVDTQSKDVAGNLDYKTTWIAGGTLYLEGWQDGAASTAKFARPYHMAYDAISDSLYITEWANADVRILDLKGMQVSTPVGMSIGMVSGLKDGPDPYLVKFNNPRYIAALDDHTFLVSESMNCVIRKLAMTEAGVVTSTFFGMAKDDQGNSVAPPCPTTKPATVPSDQVWKPNGLAIDKDGMVYVSESNAIYAIDSHNPVKKTLVAGTTASTVAKDGVGGEAVFSGVGTIVAATETAPDGSEVKVLYVNQPRSIRRVELSPTNYGAVTTIAGDETIPGWKDGPAKSAYFGSTSSIAYAVLQTHPTLFILDSSNNAIRMLDLQAGEVKTLAGSGDLKRADGTGTEASFNFPYAQTAYTDADGHVHLYVFEYNSHMIRHVNAETAEVTTVVGDGSMGERDGVGSEVKLRAIQSLLSVPSQHRIYFVESQHVRVLTP